MGGSTCFREGFNAVERRFMEGRGYRIWSGQVWKG